MTNDRSRGAALAAPAADAEPPPREAWYDRLLNVFNLRPRDSLRTDIEEALAEPDTGEDAFSPSNGPCSRTCSACTRYGWTT